MKNKLLPLLFVLASFSAYSQVGIGKVNPNPSAQLEVFANDKGILIPRVKLTGSTDVTSITKGNVESLMVFNTESISDVKAGYYYWFDNKWNRILISGEASGAAGSVTYNPVTKEFTYVDAAGNTQIVDISAMVKGNETLTTLVDKGQGLHIYTDEAGKPFDINVVSDVTSNASTIFNNANVLTELTKIVESKETLTTLEDKGQGLHTYTDEAGKPFDINVVSDVISNASTIFNNANVLTELTKIVESKETLTTLVDKGQGLHTYTDEAGNPFDINVVSDVTSNASTIFNNANVLTELTKIVESKETLTTLEDKGQGLHTYTDEAGKPFDINVVSDVTSNASTIFNNANVLTELTKIVESKETLTTLVDKGQGLHTYTDEAGNPFDINVVSDVTSNASTIFNNANVVTELTKIVASKETPTSLAYAGGKLTYTGEAQVDVIALADVKSTTPETVLKVTGGTGAAFTATAVDVVPSTVVGDVLTTTATGVVGWKEAAKSNFMGIEVIKNNYTVGDKDYTIIAEGLTGDIAITLPDPTTCKGRMLVINQLDTVKADGFTALMVGFNYPVRYATGKNYAYIVASLSNGETAGSMKVTLQSNGERWYVITYTM